MKILLWLLASCVFVFFGHDTTQASHVLGAEITWSCQGNGTYKLRLRYFRDCNGVTAVPSVNLQTNHPAGPIPLLLLQQSDISPVGFDGSGIVSCPDCSMGSSPSPIIGLVEEVIYESQDVTLNGTPPPGGWWFSYGECCRTIPLTNLGNNGSTTLFVQARMFAYNGQDAMPCNDNSPYFAEKPMSMICTGQPYLIHPGAVDPDGDVLHYGWDYLKDGLNSTLSFLPGYSNESPFPDTTQNPLNVAVSLDPVTGHISGLNYTTGKFAYKVKVTSYKCGQKVAEVERDIALAFTPNCSPLLFNIINTAPDIIPPFMNPVTGLQTEFADTVIAGDTVTATLTVTDFDLFANSASQVVTVRGAGTQFGTNFTDPQNGCPTPPCATLSASLPQTANGGVSLTFNWVTTCEHAGDTTSQCSGKPNTHVFVIWADDNYCPANARAIGTISITVKGSSIALPAGGTTFCTSDPPVNLYAWPPGGTWSGYPLGSGNLFDPAAGPGSYTVNYTWSDSAGCSSTDALVLTVNNCAGLEEPQSYPITIHPNPATDHLIIDTPYGFATRITIFNLLGQQVYEAPLPADKTIYLPVLPKDLYIVELREGNAAGRAKVMVDQR